MEFYLSFEDLSHLIAGRIGILFLPVMLSAMLAEMLVLQARHQTYNWRSAGVSVLVAIGHLFAQAATNGIIIGVIASGVYSVRLATIPVSFSAWPSLIVLFLLVDLAFYVEHFCSHRIRLLWASHSVHHSTEIMVFPAAFRLTWTPILSGVFLFYLPIVYLGFDPVWVFGVASASLTYQFFIHTELVGRIGWLEWIINTPSAHRVHHASNTEYLDKNFGGVLLIWDRLFGTYAAERADIRNPLRLVPCKIVGHQSVRHRLRGTLARAGRYGARTQLAPPHRCPAWSTIRQERSIRVCWPALAMRRGLRRPQS